MFVRQQKNRMSTYMNRSSERVKPMGRRLKESFKGLMRRVGSILAYTDRHDIDGHSVTVLRRLIQ